MLLLLVGAIALLAAPWIMRRRGGAGSGWAPGQLLVTGVSPRPDDLVGRQYVTITGVINGPTVNEHVVYQRLEVDVDDWPSMGALVPGHVLAEESGQLDLRAHRSADAAASAPQGPTELR